MSDQDRIQGKKRFDVFNSIIKEKTLVKMQILSEEYEQLTIITGVRKQGDTSFLIIDSPRKLDDEVEDLENVDIHFEFSEKDGVRLSFKCDGGKKLDKELWVEFPEYIERIQRRKDFRLWFSHGTIIHVKIDSVTYKMTLKNISMGGAYVEISMLRNEDKEITAFKSGDLLKNIELMIHSEEEDMTVNINKASIIRANEMEKQKGFLLGLQFLDIEKHEMSVLKKIIYNLQRNFLQRRLKADA